MPQLFSQTNDYSSDSIISASKKATRTALDNMSKQAVKEEQLQNSDAITGDAPKFINEFLNLMKIINTNTNKLNEELTQYTLNIIDGAGIKPRHTKKFTRRLEPSPVAHAINKKYGTILYGGLNEDGEEDSDEGYFSPSDEESTQQKDKIKIKSEYNATQFFKLSNIVIKETSDANIMFNKYIAGDLVSLPNNKIDKIKKINKLLIDEIQTLIDHKDIFKLENTTNFHEDPVLYEYLLEGLDDLTNDINIALNRFQKFNYVLTPASDAPEQLVGAGRGKNEYKLNFMTLGDSNSFRNTHPLKFKL